MDRQVIIIETPRTDYSVEQVICNHNTIKVKDFKELLECYDDEAFIITSHDGGYTYGPINIYNIREEHIEEDEEGEEIG